MRGSELNWRQIDLSLQSAASRVENIEKTDSIGMVYFDVRVYDEHDFYIGGTSTPNELRAKEIESFYKKYLNKD